MLRRLVHQLLHRRQIGRRVAWMYIAVAAELVAKLSDRFRQQAFYIAHRTADLAQDEVLAGKIGDNGLLDRVGNVRDHLDHSRQDSRRAVRGR